MTIRSTLSVVFLLLLATALVAQPQRRTPQERTDQLSTQLGLSAEQKAKVLDLFTKQDEARQKAFEANQGDREAMRASMDKMRQETTANLKAILTQEQFAKYEQLRSEMRPGGERRADAPAAPQRMTPQERTDQLAKELSLTAKQKAKVLTLFTKQDKVQEKAFTAKKDDPPAMRETMEKMRKETDKKMKSILTKKQYAKYQEMGSKMPPGGMEKKPE